jgi:hypothetical protein
VETGIVPRPPLEVTSRPVDQKRGTFRFNPSSKISRCRRTASRHNPGES